MSAQTVAERPILQQTQCSWSFLVGNSIYSRWD